jgi:hypothetical protein
MFRFILVIFLVVVLGVGLVLLTTTLKTGTKAGANHFLK